MVSRTLFSMSDKKPKIHVFMGAPRVPTEQGEEDPPGPWRTMELRWHGDKLRPRTAHNTEKDKEEQYPATSTTTEQPAGSSIGQEEQFIAADGETHVFMGAPPRASATPASLCEAGEQGEEGPPGPWRTMELCWHGGKLRPRTAQSTEANQCTHRTTTVQDVQQDKENQHPTSSTTTEQPAGSVIIVQEDDHLITTEEAVLLHAKKADQSRTAEEEEEPCSESIHEYLDSCFPLGQPDPEPPNPTERRVSPSLSIQTDFLCSWTHSQALMLRGRHAGQSGHSPDKTTMTSPRKPPTVACSQTPPQHAPQTPPKQTCTPPPQTPPKQTFTPPPQTPSKHATTPQKNNSSTSPELYSAETFTPTPTPPCPETPPKCTATTPASVSSSTPELYSPEASTQSPRKQASCHPGSMELFSEPMMASLVVEAQGGVILEVTPDGLLCSQAQEGRGVQPERGAGAGTSGGEKRQEGVVVVAGGGGDDSRVFRLTPPSPPRPRKCLAKSRSPPSESPDRKRARMSPKASATEGRPEQPVAPVVRCETSSHAGAAVQTSIMLQGPTTLLVRCVSPGVRYSVLVVVVHPCHLKEVQVKRGVLAGTSIPLASIVVTDQSGVEMKVVLWRQAAFWALTVYPGDLLLITGVEVNRDKWRGETVLQTTFASRLLNLGQITATSSPPVPQNINGRTLRSLCVFVRERRPLLAALPPHARQNPGQSLPYARQNPGQSLPYARLRFLRANTLVHALLRVSHTHNITAWQSAAEGWWRSAGLQKAVLTVEQADGQQGSVVLWGAALDWLPCINRNKDAVWDFRVLLVRDGSTSDLPELHSTPWGSVRPLAPSDSRARDFLRTSSSTSIELDLQTLLSQKYTGDVELRVQIMALQFQGSPSQNAPLQALDSSTSLEQIAETLNGDVTYTGCGRCAVELDTDVNGIYCPCYPCLPHTTVRRYFRPAVLTVREAESQLCVQVPAIQLQKMLLNTPPDKLHKTVAPGSEVRHIQLVSERVLAILSPTRRNFLLTVRSHFLCDENSVPMAQDFLLLDFSSQER